MVSRQFPHREPAPGALQCEQHTSASDMARCKMRGFATVRWFKIKSKFNLKLMN